MRTVKSKLSNVPEVKCEADSTKDLPYLPAAPLPKVNFLMSIVGSPGSGKTNLMLSLMMSKNPRYYRSLFDKTYLFSASLATLPAKCLGGKYGVPEDQIFPEYDDELLCSVLDKERKGDNHNVMIILDDVIKSIHKTPDASKMCLNRRHTLTNPKDDKKMARLSIIITTQKYNALPLEFRNASSDVMVFGTSNQAEIDAIRKELMSDLSTEKQMELLKAAWERPFGFLYIKVNKRGNQRYYMNFDRVIISEEDEEREKKKKREKKKRKRV